MVPGPRPSRLVGLDVARCVALLGMVTTHVLLDFTPEGDLSFSQWLAGGRASALFAVLAGVSLALMTGRRRPVHGRDRLRASAGLAVRAVLIAVLGFALAGLDSGLAIILTYYGVLFLLGLPFVGLRAPRSRCSPPPGSCWRRSSPSWCVRSSRTRRRRAEAREQFQVRKPRREETAGAGLGISPRPCDRGVDLRRVMRFGLRLQEDVGARIDEEVRAERVPRRRDPCRLFRDAVQAFAADHLILEIAADRAGRRQPLHIGRDAFRLDRIGAFEIHRHRQLDRRDDLRRIGQRQPDR